MVAASFKSGGVQLLAPAPAVTDPETKQIIDWVQRAFGALIPRVNEPSESRFTVLHAEPGRPREGQLVYADGSDWDPAGVGKGLVLFDGTNWRAAGSAFTNASSAPAAASLGDRWFDLDTGILYTYVSDGTDSFWVEL